MSDEDVVSGGSGVSVAMILVVGLILAGGWYLNPQRPGSPYFIGPPAQ